MITVLHLGIEKSEAAWEGGEDYINFNLELDVTIRHSQEDAGKNRSVFSFEQEEIPPEQRDSVN